MGRVRPQKYLGEEAPELLVPDRHLLVKVAGLVDWGAFDGYWPRLYGTTGKPSFDPLVCFKMLLLELWYGLSDPECEAQCVDRLSFRSFLGLSPVDAIPDETVLVRFRKQLVTAGLAEELFAAVPAHLESAGVAINSDIFRPTKTTIGLVHDPAPAGIPINQAPAGVKLSVVSTLYRSAPYIAEFLQRAGSAAQQLAGDDYEIILVNDGSPDESLDLAVQLSEADTHVVVVDLSRNFGHHKAMMAGLEHALGQRIFLIDSDLEEEPEWLLDFSDLMAAEKADVVYGKQQERKGGWFEKWSGEIYYSVFNWLCNIDHPRNIVTARLMTRRYVDALLRYREREVVISCLWVSTGFKQCEKVIKKHMSSSTTYSLPRKIEHAMNAIASFSEVPLKLIFYMGLSILACALGYAGYLCLNRVFLSRPMDGWTSVMVSVWVLGGVIISFIGVIGIYLAKVFSETKQRPYSIVRDVYGRSKSQN
ncbi:Putative glycosyltransferases (modular protein) [Syntrophobacter sp. SbD1]|nr:Putative glycosyltransferases (modular protein) [Syntrophobacter sp. SbD1]